MSKERSVIVHYHLFKNAGSSVDQLLRQNYSNQWMAFDGETPNAIIDCIELEKLILRETKIKAFSSHQIIPPLPDIDVNVYPIVFLRDPIDRIKSAYLFEWKKQLGLDTPKGKFEDYIKEKFTHKRRNSIEEFQTIRLSNMHIDRFHNVAKISGDELLENAQAFIQSLSFVGVVDEFDRSIDLLLEFLKPAFPEFKKSNVKANVLQDLSLTLESKREIIRQELSAELYEEILERNQMDEQLYQFGKLHFEKLIGNATKAA